MSTNLVRIVFAAGSTLQQQQHRPSDLPMHRNGPPGTFVVFAAGPENRTRPTSLKISLPTDLILRATEDDGHVVVTFGGFRFDGLVDGQLTFTRVQDLLPEDELSPHRSWTMHLDTDWVEVIEIEGTGVWP